MLIYIIIFLLSFFLIAIKNKKIKKIGGNCLLVVMSLMCMLRGSNVGSDTVSYITIFDSGVGLAYYMIRDPLFGIIGSIIFKISGNYSIFQIILGLLTYIPIFIIFNKYSKNIAISILFFIFATNRYFFETFNIVRQFAATSYLLWCWIMIERKEIKTAILLYIIAIGFHHTSIIFLPFAFLAYKIKLSYKSICFIVIITLVFAIGFSNMKLLVSLQEIFLSKEAVGKYDSYEKELARSIWGLLPVVLPYAFIIFYGYKKNKDNFLFRLYTYGSIFAIFISVLPMAYRISYGTSIIELLIMPLLFSQKSKHKPLLTGVTACIVLFSLTDFLTTCRLAKLVPYSIF